MSAYAARPVANNGLTTATNVSVTDTAAGLALPGHTIMLSVGTVAATAFPIFIMFGIANQAATLTSTTGFRLPAGFVGRLTAPSGATHLYYLRAAATNSDLSVLGCDGGI